MPIGKAIHDILSKKHSQKRKQLAALEKKIRIEGVKPPPKVEQWKKNTVTRASSKNVHITELVGPKPKLRQISPTEGKSAVNGKAGPDIDRKLVHAPQPKVKELDPTVGAILPIKKKSNVSRKTKDVKRRRCGHCNGTDHNIRTCPRKKASDAKS